MKNRNMICVTFLWLVCFGLPQRAQAVPVLDDGQYADGQTAEHDAVALLSLTVSSDNTPLGLFSLTRNEGDFNTALGVGLLLPNTSAESAATSTGGLLGKTIIFLLALPWIVRALVSAKAIWRGLTDGQTSERKQERCALAQS
jgi:hypothetical protein